MTAGPADTLPTPATPPDRAGEDHRRGLRSDIEGLRAFAVLAVLIYHLGAPLTGGFSGVDVFFVISGFLITSHLLKELEATGRVRLWRFYSRRAKRLLPPATLVLLATLLAGWWLLSTTQFRTLVDDVIWSAVYVVNWALAGRAVDYLAEDVEPSAVQHYWSLSVEEQFYIVIPILLLLLGLLFRRGARVAATITLVLVVAASFAASLWLTASDPAQAYFVSWTRVWELGVGSLLACSLGLLRRIPAWVAQVLAVLGVAAMVVSVTLVDATTPWPGSAALLPVLGTAAVIAAGVATPRTLVGRALSLRPLVWIGGLSYSIYLWHWPLVVYADVLWPEQPQVRLLAVLALTLVLAWLGKKLVEDPIRFGTITATAPRALGVGALAMALVVGSALGIRTTLPTLGERPAEAQGAAELGGGSAQTVSLTVAEYLESAGEPDFLELSDLDPAAGLELTRVTPADPLVPASGDAEAADPGAAEQTGSGEIYPDPGAATEDVGANYENGCHASPEARQPNPQCVFGDPDGDFVLVAVGDSKMGQWYEPLVAIAEEQGWRLEFYVKSACGFTASSAVSEACIEYNDRVMELLEEDSDRVDAVITSAGWTPAFESDRSGDVFARMWQPLVDTGIDVYALADNPWGGAAPEADREPVYECVEANRDDPSVCDFPDTPSQATNRMVMAAQQVPEARVVDLGEVICPAEGTCPAVVGGVLAYRQGSHLTTTFVESLEPYLREGLQAAGMPIE